MICQPTDPKNPPSGWSGPRTLVPHVTPSLLLDPLLDPPKKPPLETPLGTPWKPPLETVWFRGLRACGVPSIRRTVAASRSPYFPGPPLPPRPLGYPLLPLLAAPPEKNIQGKR